ncbi:Alpha/Beta hydrolase protein [Xylariales sp. PMI_506]|nr:Alpha/Beta hydrolase protein [Xylariales sp. PMI_506]
MAETSTIKVSAPSLHGELVGLFDRDSNVAMFRGIPFATVTKRWSHSVTQHSLAAQGAFDATKFGPRCCQEEGLVLVSGGVNDPTPGDDEFKCLNLNIAVPAEALQDGTAKGLPVMVWIHGGAFQHGANSVARYRPQAFLRKAREFGTPVILVQINYRLGVFGNAVSAGLAQELGGGSLTHPVGNFGLVDQRNALEWINTHIGDFGGDPGNITAFGVSAGSMSVHMHILAGESHQLFDRAILMSGAGPVLSPLPAALYEKEWESLCAKAGVEPLDAAQRLEKLRNVSPEDMLRYATKAALAPVADGKLLHMGSWQFKDEPLRGRCKDIILGDTAVEAVIFDGMLKRTPQDKFHQLAQALLSPEVLTELYAGFGFTTQPQSEEDFRTAFRLLLGNTLFNYSNVGIAEASRTSPTWADHVYLYHYDEPSPFDGPTQGLAYHGLCALMMHLNELENSPKPTQDVALEGARIWTKFAHGGQPWEPYSKEGRFQRFGPNGLVSLQSFATDTARGYKFHGVLEKHLLEVGKFVMAIMGS